MISRVVSLMLFHPRKSLPPGADITPGFTEGAVGALNFDLPSSPSARPLHQPPR